MLAIDIFSDLICPWCFIGKRRLDRVLATLDLPVAIRWRAYQLRPGLPEAGIDRRAHLARRYGADADPDRVPERLAGEAATEALVFNYGAVDRIPNTLLGHRLLAAAAGARQHDLAEALFVAYFQNGEDLGDPAVLARIAQSCGFDAAQTQAALTDERWLDVVRADLAAAQERDVSGVPCLILADRFPLPGVQADDVLVHFITRAAERLG